MLYKDFFLEIFAINQKQMLTFVEFYEYQP